jgi:hypothetical protein
MKHYIQKSILLVSLISLCCIINPLKAATLTSAQTGLFSIGSTWVGGIAPVTGDNIIISTGHTVTLDVYATVMNITINSGAVLDNDTFTLTIGQNEPGGNPVYTNNGVHNGTGDLVAYDNWQTTITGNGITNCNFVIRNFGISMDASCNLTINGNIQHEVPGNSGMNSKSFLECWEIGGELTINGDIITDELYMVGILNVTGSTITVNGNVSLPGGLETGSGSNITNSGTINISGDLVLGPYSGFCQNAGNMIVGGDLLGGGVGETYFLQEVNATVNFGGEVFPESHQGELMVSGIGLISGAPIEPNTVEYNGSSSQTIGLPSSGQPYSNLTINNSGSGVSLNSEITVNGILFLTDGLVNLGSNNLILAENASVAGTPSADNMVVATGAGELRKVLTGTGSFTFPVGDNEGTAEYSPVTLDFTAGTFNSAYAGVNLVNEAYSGVSGNYLNRYWNLTSAGITDFSCNTQFNYVTADVVGIEDSIYCYRVSPTTDRYDITNISLHRLTATGISTLGTFTGRSQGLPFVFEVTGTGSYCEGGEGLPVGLSGSETGVVYTLYKDGVAEASMAGTGSAISFGIQLPGTYTISGTNDNGTTPMTGNAVITENPLPEVTWTTFEPNMICIEDWVPIALTGGLPEGGTYSGDGVSNNIFDQAVAGEGVHLITYTYFDANNCSNTATYELTVYTCVGIEEQTTGIEIYPNPASDNLTIELNNQHIVEVNLYNTMGIRVYENQALKPTGSIVVPVQHLPAGNYFLKVTTDHETIIKSVIIR